MESKKEIEKKIIQILKQYNSEDEIDNNTSIISTNRTLIDSLNIMNLICDLEDAFQIEDLMYNDITLSNFNSVSTLVDYIYKQKGNDKNE